MRRVFGPGLALPWRYLRLPLLGLLGMLVVQSAWAARPFVTDDARIVDPGGCQIETFTRRQLRENERELWFLPGCSPRRLENVELTLGAFRVDNSIEGTFDTVIAQAKTLLRPLATGDWGLAFTLGAMRQPSPAAVTWNPYVNLVASRALADDRTVLHFNAGALYNHQSTRTLYTWGAGAEVLLVGRLSAIAENYGAETEKPSTQVGLRYWIRPDRVQVDGTLGTQNGPDARRNWMSLGLRLLF